MRHNSHKILSGCWIQFARKFYVCPDSFTRVRPRDQKLQMIAHTFRVSPISEFSLDIINLRQLIASEKMGTTWTLRFSIYPISALISILHNC